MIIYYVLKVKELSFFLVSIYGLFLNAPKTEMDRKKISYPEKNICDKLKQNTTVKALDLGSLNSLFVWLMFNQNTFI